MWGFEKFVSDVQRDVRNISSTVENAITRQVVPAVTEFANDAYENVVVPVVEGTPGAILETGRFINEVGSAVDTTMTRDVVPAVTRFATDTYDNVIVPVVESTPGVIADLERNISDVGSVIDTTMTRVVVPTVTEFANDVYDKVIVPVAQSTSGVLLEAGRVLNEVGSAVDTTMTRDVVPAVTEFANDAYENVILPVAENTVIISTALTSLLSTATDPIILNPSDYLSLGETLDPSSEMYGTILEYINNSQEHGFRIKVKNIMSIERRNNHGFRQFLGKGNRMMLCHGTSVNNLSSIITGGFKLPGPEKTKLLHGRGIYFADRSSKSAQYGDSTSTGQDGILMLCEVILGDSSVEYRGEDITAHYGWTSPPSGKDSVTSPGKRVADENGNKWVNGVIFPMGRSRGHENPRDCFTDLSEYVVYNPDQIDVKYVVTFTSTPATTQQYLGCVRVVVDFASYLWSFLKF